MQLIEKKHIEHPEINSKQALISSLTYWKHHLKNIVNKCSLLLGNLLREGTSY